MSESQSEWTEAELKKFISLPLRHFVGLSITYIVKGKTEERFHCFSAFVITINDQWMLVTAGHILSIWKPLLDSGECTIKTNAIVDYFGGDAEYSQPIPFDLFGQPSFSIFDEVLNIDFAIIPIRNLYRQNMEANRILPLSINWETEHFEEFDAFAVVGIPEEKPFIAKSPKASGGAVKPVWMPVARQPCETPAGEFSRFVATIVDMGAQKSVKGMSGGPIFGYSRNASKHDYEVIAIQSSWNKKDTIYGCPIKLVFETIIAAMNKPETANNKDS